MYPTSHLIPHSTLQVGLYHMQKNMHLSASSWMCFVSTSKIKVKIQGLRVESWCKLIVMWKSLCLSTLCSYISRCPFIHIMDNSNMCNHNLFLLLGFPQYIYKHSITHLFQVNKNYMQVLLVHLKLFHHTL